MANSQEVLDNVPIDQREAKSLFDMEKTNTIKALGIKWSPTDDCLTYTYAALTTHNKITKRKLLGEVCKLYDPLGWISPIIVKAKILNRSGKKKSIGMTQYQRRSRSSGHSWLNNCQQLRE